MPTVKSFFQNSLIKFSLPFQTLCHPTVHLRRHCIGERYLKMLNDHLLPELRKVRKIRSTIFMQDGAPAHTSNGVKEFLTQHFGDRIISRHFPNFWPPRSPDINLCDLWLWGYLSSKVYQRIPPKDKKELILRIREAIRNITKEMTAAATDNVLKRLHAVVEGRGSIFNIFCDESDTSVKTEYHTL